MIQKSSNFAYVAQAVTYTNDDLLLIWTVGTNIIAILVKIQHFHVKKINLKISPSRGYFQMNILDMKLLYPTKFHPFGSSMSWWVNSLMIRFPWCDDKSVHDMHYWFRQQSGCHMVCFIGNIPRLLHPKFVSSAILAEPCSSITYGSLALSFWNFAQSTAVSLPCSVQNFKMFEPLKWILWMNEIFWDLMGIQGLSSIATTQRLDGAGNSNSSGQLWYCFPEHI